MAFPFSVCYYLPPPILSGINNLCGVNSIFYDTNVY